MRSKTSAILWATLSSKVCLSGSHDLAMSVERSPATVMSQDLTTSVDPLSEYLFSFTISAPRKVYQKP